MSDAALHPTPRPWDAAREQLRTVGIAIRREAAFVAALVAVPTLTALVHASQVGEPLSFGRSTALAPLGVLAGAAALLAPAAVWKGEARFGGSPLWFLPVRHRRHALLKVGAGWAWLMATLGATLLWIVLITLLSGGTLGVPEVRWVLDTSEPSGARSVQWSAQWWHLLALFTGTTTLYMLASGLLLVTERPWRWLAGVAFGVLILGMIAVEGRVAWLYDALVYARHHFTLGPYGLDALLTGGVEGLQEVHRLPSGERVAAWRELPTLGRWATATVLWTGMGFAALLGAASRHCQGGAK